MSCNNTSIKLTVYFEDPFWVGLFERSQGHRYQVARVVFGSEPKSYDIMHILSNYHQINFGDSIPLVQKKPLYRINPKRMQRLVNRSMDKRGIGTAAQEAVRLQREVDKKTRQETRQSQKEALQRKKFEQKQQKKKEKKRGH